MSFEPDPLSIPFWDAAVERRLVVQRCASCGEHQFYARPYCVRCSGEVEWVDASGSGTIYSATTVHMQVKDDLEPPYDVAIVELDEGPRVISTLAAGEAVIGSRVRVDWRDRDGAPPLPVFVTEPR